MSNYYSNFDDANSFLIHQQCVTHNGFTVIKNYSKQEWLECRQSLLNKPSWDDLDDDIVAIALNRNLEWVGSNTKDLMCAGSNWYIFSCPSLFIVTVGTAYAIPSGVDWKDTLEFRPQSN